MEESTFVHKSVLLYETVGSLNIKPGGLYVDGTLGGGGHAYEVCKRLGSGKLIWHRPGCGRHRGGREKASAVSGQGDHCQKQLRQY